jgi:hypothetical protein
MIVVTNHTPPIQSTTPSTCTIRANAIASIASSCKLSLVGFLLNTNYSGRITAASLGAITMSKNANLNDVIAQCHQGLDEFFLLHQEAVLIGKFDDAIQLLNCFKELHHIHMTFEDKQLIPKLEELGDRGRWPASLYSSEHNKIQELLQKAEDRLLALKKSHLGGKIIRRDIITFIENEKVFKGVCEHHQEREEAGLLPELDKQADLKWRANIIDPFFNEWNNCMKRCLITIDGIDWL